MPNPRRPIDRLIVVAIMIALAFLLVVVNFPAFRAYREARRREQASENLRKIGLALKTYGNVQKIFPPAVVAAEGNTLPFDTYSGYFVSNKFEPDAAESFAVVGSQKQFDKLLGVAMVMGDKSHRLPKDALQSNIVLLVVKRGHAFWEYKVEGVTEDNGVVTLRYTTTSRKSDTATFACPLITSIHRGKYTAIRFIENGKPVRELKLDQSR